MCTSNNRYYPNIPNYDHILYCSLLYYGLHTSILLVILVFSNISGQMSRALSKLFNFHCQYISILGGPSSDSPSGDTLSDTGAGVSARSGGVQYPAARAGVEHDHQYSCSIRAPPEAKGAVQGAVPPCI